MKNPRTIATAILCLALSACTVSTARPREYVVSGPPPAPRVETRPAAPSRDATWVSGHWELRDGRYSWVRGRWVTPRPGYVYEPGHWLRRGDEYVWVEPRWVRVHPGGTVVRPAERRGAYRY